MTRTVYSEKELEQVVSEFDAIITGSDQIWNSACIPYSGLFYFGIHANPSRQKLIAYAPSFGKYRFEAEKSQIEILKQHLKKFHAISVREDDGLKLLRDVFQISTAVKVLDPTMLMDAEYYLSLCGIRKIRPRKTLAYYLLDRNTEKMKVVNDLAQKYHLTPVNMYCAEDNGFPLLGRLHSLRYPSMKHWIQSIAEAQLVVTDSFHGTVFSILFNRDFITFGNAARGISRFQSLLPMFGLERRLIDTERITDIVCESIDYTAVKAKLEELREQSRSFLINALK